MCLLLDKSSTVFYPLRNGIKVCLVCIGNSQTFHNKNVCFQRALSEIYINLTDFSAADISLHWLKIRENVFLLYCHILNLYQSSMLNSSTILYFVGRWVESCFVKN